MLNAPVLRAIPTRDLTVRIELDKAALPLRDLPKLRESILLLDRNANDPVDISANEHVIARGELMLTTEQRCVRVTEILREKHPARRAPGAYPSESSPRCS